MNNYLSVERKMGWAYNINTNQFLLLESVSGNLRVKGMLFHGK